jgi:rubrerythrin
MAVEEFDRQSLGTGHGPLHRFRCLECSYGASRRLAPERCPMCGGSVWEFEPWRLFSEIAQVAEKGEPSG